MTQAEMACCKKMAGDCENGAAQHPCCKTSVNVTPTVAKVERNVSQIQPDVPAALNGILFAEYAETSRRNPNHACTEIPPVSSGALMKRRIGSSYRHSLIVKLKVD